KQSDAVERKEDDVEDEDRIQMLSETVRNERKVAGNCHGPEWEHGFYVEGNQYQRGGHVAYRIDRRQLSPRGHGAHLTEDRELRLGRVGSREIIRAIHSIAATIADSLLACSARPSGTNRSTVTTSSGASGVIVCAGASFVGREADRADLS